MPSFGREVEVEGNGTSNEFVCIATYLPLRSWRHVVPFLSMSGRVQNQLKQTRGLARYAVKTDPFRGVGVAIEKLKDPTFYYK